MGLGNDILEVEYAGPVPYFPVNVALSVGKFGLHADAIFSVYNRADDNLDLSEGRGNQFLAAPLAVLRSERPKSSKVCPLVVLVKLIANVGL